MIEVDFNDVGMIIFYCNHVKGYNKDKGKNICEKCKIKVMNSIMKELESK